MENKRLALDALAIKVTAIPEQIEIKGVIPIEITLLQSSKALLTIEQTSGCLISCTYDWPSGEEAVSIITTNANKPI